MKLTRFIPLAVVVAAAGCAPFSTYPPVEGQVSISQPSFAPFPDLMAWGLRGAQQQLDDPNEIVFNLPAGTPSSVYDRVIDRLGEGRPQTDVSDRAYHVTEVRSRGFDASVDVISPRDDGHYSLVTVNLRNDLGSGWRIDSTRLWRIQVQVPPPHFVPPAPEDQPDVDDDALAAHAVE